MSRGLMSVIRRWHSRSAALLDGAQAKIRASLNHVHTLVGGGGDGTEPLGGGGQRCLGLDLGTGHLPA